MATVMLVDDDIFIQRSLSMLLTLKGHTIVGQAYNGQEAIEMFIQMNQKPDIILMDYRMPVMNGISATKAIISVNPSSRILFLSAESTAAKEAIELGALEFLIKPIRPKELLAVVEKYHCQYGIS